jgi:hypothetical protein
MELQPYHRNRHYASIALWYEDHAMAPVPPECLPKLGYFVPSTAAGFLYQTDSGVAFIEGLITSRYADPHKRYRALNEITRALCEDAKSLGFQIISAFTQHPGIRTLARRHGFSAQHGHFELLTRRF